MRKFNFVISCMNAEHNERTFLNGISILSQARVLSSPTPSCSMYGNQGQDLQLISNTAEMDEEKLLSLG
jgi:hypothetical protein